MSKPTRLEMRELVRNRLVLAPELPDRAIARQLEVSHSFVGSVRREFGLKIQLDTSKNEWMKHPHLVAHPDILDNLSERGLRAIKAPGVLDLMQSEGLTSPIYAQRVLRRQEKAARKCAAGIELSESDIKLMCADIRAGLPEIADKSIDVIITDPPYGKEYVPLYSALGEFAVRVLTDKGILLCMTGHSHLPDAMCLLGEHLRYWWTLCVETPRQATALHYKRISTYWKPVLMYTRGEAYTGDLVSDLIKAPADAERTDKAHHQWGQSEYVISELIKRFSDPLQTVCDPFLGGGTTALCALNLSRRCVVADIDPECVKVTRKRVDALLYGNVDK